MARVRGVLGHEGARYRYGAPLDVRWMAGGWSAHLKFQQEALRVRTDFVTRPLRIGAEDLASLWDEQEGLDLPVVDVRRLLELKKTHREKDYVIIGELARRLQDPRDCLLGSRSARDITELLRKHPALHSELAALRPVLAEAGEGIGALERALDAERRSLIHACEARLRVYLDAAAAWARVWPEVGREISGLPLPEAHGIFVERAEGVLPFRPEGFSP